MEFEEGKRYEIQRKSRIIYPFCEVGVVDLKRDRVKIEFPDMTLWENVKDWEIIKGGENAWKHSFDKRQQGF